MIPGMRSLTVEFVNLAKLGMPREKAAAYLSAFHYQQGRRVLIKTADQLASERMDRSCGALSKAPLYPMTRREALARPRSRC
jgi:hypothetical protein